MIPSREKKEIEGFPCILASNNGKIEQIDDGLEKLSGRTIFSLAGQVQERGIKFSELALCVSVFSGCSLDEAKEAIRTLGFNAFVGPVLDLISNFLVGQKKDTPDPAHSKK